MQTTVTRGGAAFSVDDETHKALDLAGARLCSNCAMSKTCYVRMSYENCNSQVIQRDKQNPEKILFDPVEIDKLAQICRVFMPLKVGRSP